MSLHLSVADRFSRMRVLVTGFEKFGPHAANPSEDFVLSLQEESTPILTDRQPRPGSAFPSPLLPGGRLATAVLPVAYRRAEIIFQSALAAHQPEVVLAFGVGSPGSLITLERLGVNIDDASAGDGRPDSGLPDNDGEIRIGSRIVEEATTPPAYWSTLPIDRMLLDLRDAGIAARTSNHAGAFLCNHLLFFGLHLAATATAEGRPFPPFRMGFIHLPPFGAPVGNIDSENRKIRRCETRRALAIMVASLEPPRPPENSP